MKGRLVTPYIHLELREILNKNLFYKHVSENNFNVIAYFHMSRFSYVFKIVNSLYKEKTFTWFPQLFQLSNFFHENEIIYLNDHVSTFEIFVAGKKGLKIYNLL